MFWTLSKVSLLNYTNIVDEQSIFTSTTRISEISKGDISMIYCSSSIIEMKKIVITTSALLYKKWPYLEFFWSAFSWIRTKYGNLQSKSPYSVRMRANADQKNSEYEYFSHRALSWTPTPLENQYCSISKQYCWKWISLNIAVN